MTTTDSPWIPIREQHPKEIDWDKTHAVEFCDIIKDARYTYTYWTIAWKDRLWTHWRRVELPELPEKELSQADKDAIAYKSWYMPCPTAGYSPRDAFVWTEALRIERAYLGMPAEQFVKELLDIFGYGTLPSLYEALSNVIMNREKHDRLLAIINRAYKGLAR